MSQTEEEKRGQKCWVKRGAMKTFGIQGDRVKKPRKKELLIPSFGLLLQIVNISGEEDKTVNLIESLYYQKDKKYKN